MAIQFACSHCGKQYQTGEHLAGKKIRCKQCGEVATIPGARRGPDPAVDPYASDEDEAPRKPRATEPGGTVLPRLRTPAATNESWSEPKPKKKKKRKRGSGNPLNPQVLAGLGAFFGVVILSIVVTHLPAEWRPSFWPFGSHDALRQEEIDLLNEFSNVLGSVKDAPTAQAAKPKIKDVARRTVAYVRRVKDIKVSQAEADRLHAKYDKLTQAAVRRTTSELMRVASVPGGREAIADSLPEFQELAQMAPNGGTSMPGGMSMPGFGPPGMPAGFPSGPGMTSTPTAPSTPGMMPNPMNMPGGMPGSMPGMPSPSASGMGGPPGMGMPGMPPSAPPGAPTLPGSGMPPGFPAGPRRAGR